MPQATIVDGVAHFIRRFVFLPAEPPYRFLASWIIATPLHKEFEFMGYPFAHSAEEQCGKSRLLEVFDLLVFNSSGLLVSPTEAVLFRTADGMTQLLDEVDSWRNPHQLKAVLNAGYCRSGKVARVEKDSLGGFAVNFLPVYGPRALAGIELRMLDRTTRDRTFMTEMVRQKREERREVFRRRKVGPQGEALKKEIKEWASQHRLEVAQCYERREFGYLDSFRDRTIDVTEPLAAILETAYRGHAQLQKEARLDLVEAIALTRKQEESLAPEHRLLLALTELAQAEDPLVGSARKLANRCGIEGVSEYTVGAILHRYGFETKSMRRDGQARYCYQLPHDKLADLAARYACKSDEGDAA